MKMTGLLGAIALATLATQAAAVEVTLCSGRSGGGYDAVMKGIAAELQKRGAVVKINNLPGSEDILRSLEAGTCEYGPAQKDVHYLLSKSDSSLTSVVSPVEVLYKEAMTLVCSASSRYDELSDLVAGDVVIVGEIGSGSALTWESLISVEKEFGNGSDWINATPEYSELAEASASLALGSAKCAFGVGAIPSAWALHSVQQGNTISWVEDKDINDLEYAGGPLYPAGSVSSEPYGAKFNTHYVPAILFRSTKAEANAEVLKVVRRVAPGLGARQGGSMK